MEESAALPPLPELVDMAEIASMLDVSKQRVRELAARDDYFPPPVARLGGRPVYSKTSIEAFGRWWSRTPGRPVRQAQVSAELAHIPKDTRDLDQQTLRMVYNITRLHDLKVDPTTPRDQSLFRAIERMTPQPGFKPRYDPQFFEPEPPDSRYIKLHTECCASEDFGSQSGAEAGRGAASQLDALVRRARAMPRIGDKAAHRR
jgi:hypothetical protein